MRCGIQARALYQRNKICYNILMNIHINYTAYPRPSGWCWRGDEVSVAGRLDAHGVLDEAGEAVADPLGGAAIEAERVLVEVGREVLLAHRPVVGAQEPALDEAEDEVDAGQPERGVAPGRAEIDGLVVVARGRQAEVAAPAVRRHGRRPGDVGGEEGGQALGRGVGQQAEPEPAEAATAGLAAAGLDRPGDQGLAGGAPAALAGSRATDVGLVGLDALGQGLTIRADHGLAELVQPGPGGPVAAEAQLPLQLGGGDPALARGHQVDGEEPARQAGLGLLEDRAGEQGVLLATGDALVDDLGLQRVRVAMAAPGTPKSTWPAGLEQVLPALLIGAELGQERWHVFRQIVRKHRCPTTHC